MIGACLFFIVRGCLFLRLGRLFVSVVGRRVCFLENFEFYIVIFVFFQKLILCVFSSNADMCYSFLTGRRGT